jgi:hypothetical protein
MNKTFTIGAALVWLCIGFQSANASLLGMPLNLKATLAQADPDRSASPRFSGASFFCFMPVTCWPAPCSSAAAEEAKALDWRSIVRCRIEIARRCGNFCYSGE